MKVAVYTLTRDRLDYTKHCFQTLRDKAGYPFDHHVIDNGSSDGTQSWLRDTYLPTSLTLFSDNMGIHEGSNRAFSMMAGKYDLIIKMDNDCEVDYQNIIKRIVDIYSAMPPLLKMILSPRVEGINNQPRRIGERMIDGARVGLTGHVGGLFMVIPGFVINEMGYRCPGGKLGQGMDSTLCQWFRRQGGEVGYLESIVVNHYETTNQQAVRYPDYFQRKKEELG